MVQDLYQQYVLYCTNQQSHERSWRRQPNYRRRRGGDGSFRYLLWPSGVRVVFSSATSLDGHLLNNWCKTVSTNEYFSRIAPVVNHSSHFLFKYSRLDRSDWYCLDPNLWINLLHSHTTTWQNTTAFCFVCLFVCLFCFVLFVYSVSRISEGNESCWKTSRRRCVVFSRYSKMTLGFFEF